MAVLDAVEVSHILRQGQAVAAAVVLQVRDRVDAAVQAGGLQNLIGPVGLEFLGSVGHILGQISELAVLDVGGQRGHKGGNDVDLVAGQQQVDLLCPVTIGNELQIVGDAVTLLSDGVDGGLDIFSVGHIAHGGDGDHDGLDAGFALSGLAAAGGQGQGQHQSQQQTYKLLHLSIRSILSD